MSKTRKVLQFAVVIVLGLVLVGSGFWLGWSTGSKHSENITVTDAVNIFPGGSGASTSVSAADFSTFWQAWQDIDQYYLNNPSTTPQDKLYGAINGLVSSTGDPYTEFFDPQDSQQFQGDLTGNFGGVGAELGTNASGSIIITGTIAGTPAAAAGLKGEDVIEAVDGSSIAAMTIDDVVNAIRGPVGTPVTLSILRAGFKASQDFTITRADISVPTVQFAMKGDVAVITLNEFTQDADSLFYQSLQKAVSDNAQGIVLDLRGDPGGYLEVAVDLAGYFLKPGAQVVKEVGRAVPTENYTAQGNGALDTMPMAILLDGNTASAAEIMSGALNDDRGIPLVGEKSYGKGTVQQLFDLSDGSSLKITVAHWVLPNGQILDHNGLIPNYVVTPSAADIASGNDVQLTKALQVVAAEIAGTPLPASNASSIASSTGIEPAQAQ